MRKADSRNGIDDALREGVENREMCWLRDCPDITAIEFYLVARVNIHVRG
jgi:hypothetical protein